MSIKEKKQKELDETEWSEEYMKGFIAGLKRSEEIIKQKTSRL